MSKEYPSCQSHCCVVHGCKYGHEECPVAISKVLLDYLCEQCSHILDVGPEMVRRLVQVRELRNSINSSRIQRTAGTHKLPVLDQCTIPEVLDHFGQGDRVYGGWVVNMGSQRYELFKAKGTRCATCGLKGHLFLLQREMNQKTNPPNRAHFNLYGQNDEGELVLFTKDHIVPKSAGGKNRLDNYQTMCQPCNTAKADKV